ncbi:MAG: DMT family transporter [Myxococcales bacterium]|nr:DMT family transporter [Myxococcales bacterium]MDH3842608.1 DMT family transporter [Myxococcales bacterium]
MGFTIGVAAAFCWAALDVVRKALSDKASPAALAVILLIGQVPFLGLWAALDQTWVVSIGYWVPAVASMAMNALANVLFMRSLQLSPMSRTVPFLALSPVFGALVAIPLLREVPGLLHLGGIGLVVFGALVLNSDLSESWWRSVFKEKGAPHMIAVAFLWSGSVALDKLALPHASPASHAFLLTAGSGLMLVAWVGFRGELGDLQAAWRAPKSLLAALIGFAIAALALQMFALGWLWIAVVETLKRGIGVLGSIAFGRLFFSEPITHRKLLAGSLMVAGTALLVLT